MQVRQRLSAEESKGMSISKGNAQQVERSTFHAKTIRWFILTSIMILCPLLPAVTASAQGQTWERGKLVGLSAGTCIREGPGFSYRAHTRVPESNWTVMVIDGPRTADGRTWWDTSRNAAGDPSGGTGWVTQDQSDTNCDQVIIPTEPATPTPVHIEPTPITPPTTPVNGQDLLRQVQTWWYQQPALVKWGVAVLALLFLSLLWRFIGGMIIELIGATVLALVIWVLLNLTRPIWQDVWQSLAYPVFGGDVPDLALLLGVLPLASWGLSLLLRSIRVRR